MDLTTAIPSFPPQPVLHLSNDKATTMLPLVNRDLCGEHHRFAKKYPIVDVFLTLPLIRNDLYHGTYRYHSRKG